MNRVRRVYVEKRPPYAVRAKELREEISSYLNIVGLTGVRVFVRYDIENISESTYQKALHTVFSEPPIDIIHEEEFSYDKDKARIFSVEYLPGQFDQRADSAEQCVKLLGEGEDLVIKTATTYLLEGKLDDIQFDRIKSFCINPVDSRESGLEKPETLMQYMMNRMM
jgi:phosphoribosylformylglycinamidine synthase